MILLGKRGNLNENKEWLCEYYESLNNVFMSPMGMREAAQKFRIDRGTHQLDK